MGLDYAIDELYATGWSPLNSAGCEHAPDGRAYPGEARVQEEFARAGHSLSIRYVSLFDCHRAEWCDAGGAVVGSVVGSTKTEATVYALAQLRRLTVGAAGSNA